MRWYLDPPIRVGQRVFAVLTQIETSAHSVGLLVLGTASKRPLTVLMLDGEQVTALDLDGHAHSPEETAQTYQAAVARLRDLQVDGSDIGDPDQ